MTWLMAELSALDCGWGSTSHQDHYDLSVVVHVNCWFSLAHKTEYRRHLCISQKCFQLRSLVRNFPITKRPNYLHLTASL